jgi:hypothetical protein
MFAEAGFIPAVCNYKGYFYTDLVLGGMCVKAQILLAYNRLPCA